MTAIEHTGTSSLLANFEAAAKAAQVAETELRRKLATEIARSERNRIYAFRRIRLLKTLAESAASQTDDPDVAWTAQRNAVSSDLGWSAISESYAAILEHIRPLAAAIRASLQPGSDAGSNTILQALEQFEQWFEQTHNKAFYALYDQYVPEVPIVDF